MSSSDEGGSPSTSHKKYRGVRRRKWGKWVSEIRVPGTQDRLWLGSYSTPEAAAVAHDVASYCLQGPSSMEKLNFPHTLPSGVRIGMSPSSVQQAASDAGMAVDAQFTTTRQPTDQSHNVEVNSSSVPACEVDYGKWQHGGHGEDLRNWEGSDQLGKEEPLNISVDDYL